MLTRQPLQYHFNNRTQYELSLKLHNTVINTRPKLTQIIVSLSSTHLNSNYTEDFLGLLQLITKQGVMIRRSSKPVINLKIQKNQIVAFSVILRKYNMYAFLTHLIMFNIPRSPFFEPYHFKFNRGDISYLYDKFYLFSEIDENREYKNSSIFPNMNITLRTSTKTKYEAAVLLNQLQIPCKIH